MQHSHNIIDKDNHFIINPVTRKIQPETHEKNKMVEGDHNSEKYTFEVPKLIEGHDMSQCNIVQIHYLNVSSDKSKKVEDVYEVDDLGVLENKDDTLAFTWTIKETATRYNGLLSFAITFKCTTNDTVDYAWHTEIYTGITIGKGMNNSETIVIEYSDILEKWKKELFAIDGTIQTTARKSLEEIEKAKNNSLESIAQHGTVQVSNEEPTDPNVDLFINPDETVSVSIPEINDSGISTEDTWSSEKIDSELKVIDNKTLEVKNKIKKQHELFKNTVGLNKCDTTKIEWSKNLSNSDGSEIVAVESYGVTPFIRLENVKKVNFYTCDVSGIPVGGCFNTFFYTEDQVLILHEKNDNCALQQSISVPLNARYTRFVVVKYVSRPKYMLVFNRDDTPNYEAYKEVEPPNVAEKLKVIDAIKDGSNAKAGYALKIKTLDESGKPNEFEYGEASGSVRNTLVTSTNKLDNSKVIEGYYGKDGAYKKTSGFSTVSEMIPLDLKSKIINIYGCDAVGVPNNKWYSLVFFDVNKEYIQGSGVINSDTATIENTVYNIPSNAKYVIPSFLVAKKTVKYMLTFEETMYGYDEFNQITVPYDISLYKLRTSKWEGKKVLVIGDSISTSNYRGLQENGQNNPIWKKWDDILADRLGFDMTKDAISSSGFIVQPTTTAVGKDSICNRVDNYPSDGNYDMIIIFAGINDFLQGIPVGTVTGDKTANFISAVDYSVKTLIERFPKARLVAMLPLPIGMYSEFSQNDTSEYVNALIDRYNYYGVPYLDLAHNSGFRPHVKVFKDMFTLRGGSSSNPVFDGLHPNQDWDNNYLAPMVEKFISKFI